MDIEEINAATPELYAEVKALMDTLSPGNRFTMGQFRAVVEGESNHLFCLSEGGHLAGCATFCTYDTPLGKKGIVEDVVVRADYRGQHLGRRLLEHILGFARGFAPIDVHLTSRPSRVAANELYRSLGFDRHETNVYILPLR